MSRVIEIGGVYKNSYGNRFGRRIFTTIDKVKDYVEKFNGIDVYTTVYTYDTEDQNSSSLYGPMYIDLDMDFNTEEQYAVLKRELLLIVQAIEDDYFIPRDRLLFYFTGKKGFHILIPQTIYDLDIRNNTNIIYKEIAKDLNSATLHGVVDTKIYDNKRLFRLPNTINSKSGLYKVPVTFDNIIDFSFEDMRKYASAPKSIEADRDFSMIEKAKEKFYSIVNEIESREIEVRKRRLNAKPIDVKDVKLFKCVNNIILNGANAGQRNNTCVVLASSLFQSGICKEQIEEIIKEWNNALVTPPIDEMEIELTINSAEAMYLAGRSFGCAAIKDLGMCDSECKWNK